MTERKKGQNRVAKLLKLEAGQSFTGKYLGITIQDWADDTYSPGETRELTSFIFSSNDGSRFMYRGDAGFKSAFSSSLVEKGETITVLKKEKVDIGGDRYMNTYEIFEA